MAFLTTKDGTRLFYNDWGAGRPIVLIHGWPLDADMWEYQATELARLGLRVVTYDRRGFGRSDQPWSGYDYDTLADDLAAVLETLDLQGATLAGFSMGGGEVARYLSRHGATRIAKAVLISAVTPYLVQSPNNEEGVPRSVFDQIVQGLEADRPHFLAAFGKQFFGAGLLNFSVSTEMLNWAGNLALMASKKATLDCVRSFSETDFRPDLAAITIPTLVIHGDADATVPIDKSGRRTAQMIATARLLEYEGGPHAVFFSHKDRLVKDLYDFVSG